MTRYRQEWYLRLLFFYLIFLSPLTSLIDFFSLLTICLSLSQPMFFPLQIRFSAPPLTLNVFLSLCTLNQTQKSSFFFLYRVAELWIGSWLVETVDGSVGLGFLAGCWLSFGFGWWSWLCRLPISISPRSWSRICQTVLDLACRCLAVQVSLISLTTISPSRSSRSLRSRPPPSRTLLDLSSFSCGGCGGVF